MAINIKKIKPLFTSLVTTMNRYEDDVYENGLVRYTKGTIKEYQTVVAVGANVSKDVTVGCTVMLDLKRFSKVNQKEDNSIKETLGMHSEITIVPDIIIIDGKECLFLQDRDIAFVFEGEEVLEKKSNIIVPKLGY